LKQNEGFDQREAEGKLYNLLAKKRVPVDDLKMLVSSAVNDIPLELEELPTLQK